MNRFFAYVARLRLIRRWALMRNAEAESVQEHSWRVAVLAHALALLRNREFGGAANPERAAALALFHDAAEAVTGDLPTPVKYFSPEIRDAYRDIEAKAKTALLELLPAGIRGDYAALLSPGPADADEAELVHWADKLCAWLKCREELKAGNSEFGRAELALRAALDKCRLPEVRLFMEKHAPAFDLTLDELAVNMAPNR